MGRGGNRYMPAKCLKVNSAFTILNINLLIHTVVDCEIENKYLQRKYDSIFTLYKFGDLIMHLLILSVIIVTKFAIIGTMLLNPIVSFPSLFQ